ncbi:hypothetical protein MNV49_002713 [Pseudohyphozyma bogoriensis]|nr:hypothetical protein MNV49_002713 [Pseudohyphozyma bogoriensis]
MPAESAAAPLAFPSIPRPKGIAERAVLKKTTGSSSGSGLLKPMLRKRSDSLKWSKYQGMASFELDLSPDELKRV